MARPSKDNPKGAQKSYKQTPEVIVLLKQAFSVGSSIREACIHAGISDSTYYEWVNKDKKLSEEFDRLREQPILKARQTIVKSLNDPNHAKWYLERKLKNEFSQKIDNTHGGGDNPIEMDIKWVVEVKG